MLLIIDVFHFCTTAWSDGPWKQLEPQSPPATSFLNGTRPPWLSFIFVLQSKIDCLWIACSENMSIRTARQVGKKHYKTSCKKKGQLKSKVNASYIMREMKWAHGERVAAQVSRWAHSADGPPHQSHHSILPDSVKGLLQQQRCFEMYSDQSYIYISYITLKAVLLCWISAQLWCGPAVHVVQHDLWAFYVQHLWLNSCCFSISVFCLCKHK